jgi:DNA-binding SARP family transcriptional activator/tetratricopeptide (TPR) repeat protein
VSSTKEPTTAVGVRGKGLANWRPQIQKWIDDGEYERVLDRFEAWDDENAEWWSLFGSFLDGIPTEYIHRRPGILLRTVVPMVWAGHEAEAYAILKAADDVIAELRDDNLAIFAEVTRANLYVVTKRLDEALALLSAVEGKVREAKHRLQVLNALGLLQATHSFELDKARVSFTEHATLALDAGIAIAHIVAIINRAWHVELIQGRFREARILGRKLFEMRSSPNDSPFCKLCASMIVGAIEYELGEDGAQESFKRSLEIAERLNYRDIVFASCEFLAILFAEQGKVAEADEWVRRCESMQNDEKRPSPALYWAKARLAALAGDLAGTERHLEFAAAESNAPDMRSGTELERSRCLYAAGKLEEAAERAESAMAIAEEYGLRFTATRARVLRCACEVGGIRTPLGECLRESLLADYDGLFLRRDPEIGAKVLNQAMALDVESDYARSLLDQMGCPTVRLRTFGGLRVWVGVRVLSESDWPRPRARALFAYLALRNKRPVAAEQLMLTFWPDQTPEAARNSLRVAITYVRNALEPGRPKGQESKFLRFEDDVVVLDLGHAAWIDATVFDRLGKRALALGSSDLEMRLKACEQAIEVVDGPFLPEYAGHERMEGSAERADAMLREVRLRASADALALGKPEAALRQSDALLSADRCDEAALDVAVSALVSLERKADAARVVRRFAKAWSEELGLDLPATVRSHLARFSS